MLYPESAGTGGWWGRTSSGLLRGPPSPKGKAFGLPDRRVMPGIYGTRPCGFREEQ